MHDNVERCYEVVLFPRLCNEELSIIYLLGIVCSLLVCILPRDDSHG